MPFALVISIICLACFLITRILFIAPFLPGLIFFFKGKMFRRVFSLLPRDVYIYAALCFVVFFLSAVFSVDAENTIKRAVKASILLSVGGLSWLGYRRHSDVLRRYMPIALMMAVTGALALMVCDIYMDFFFMRHVLGYGDSFLLRGLNRSAIVVVLWMVPTMYLFLCNDVRIGDRTLPKNIKLYWSGALAVLLAFLLVFTDCQGAQMAVVLGLVTFFIFPVSWKWSWVFLKVILAVCVFAAPVIAIEVFEVLSQNEAFIQHPMVQKGAGGHRLEIWYSLSQLILDRYMIGYGMDATSSLHLNAPELILDRQDILHPHNFAIQLWVEFGVWGAILGVIALCFIVDKISAVQSMVLRRAMLANFAGWLVVAATGYNIWQSWWIGLAFSLIYLWGMVILKSNDDTMSER